jgi:hypothetical protein
LAAHRPSPPWAYGWLWVDPVASILIALLMIYSAWSLLSQSAAVLMEGVPSHIDLDVVRDSLRRVPGVEDVHDLHVWSITSGFVALSAHLVLPAGVEPQAVLRASEECLAEKFGIRHSTLQLDSAVPCGQAHHDPHETWVRSLRSVGTHRHQALRCSAGLSASPGSGLLVRGRAPRRCLLISR